MATTFPLHNPENFGEATKKIQDTIVEADEPERAIRSLLDLGEEMLEVENVHVTRIEPAVDYWEAIESTDQHRGIIVPGQTIDLENTYCRRVIQNEETVTLSHASEQGWNDDPAYEAHQLECYLGTSIHTEGDLFGTVCFVAQEPRDESFTAEERIFAEQLGFELGQLIERQRLETRFERRTEINAVLGRILRHNLRNELTVIRGHAELVAEKSNADLSDDLAPLLDRIDALEALADKSRHIDTITALSSDREHIQLNELLTSVITRVQEDYPDSRFETDLSETTLQLAPSMERAFIELIENAAKHGGDPPHVEIRTQPKETVVVIDIADNGPGIPGSDRRIFEHTIETALEHGSGIGLWLVSWIVENHQGDIEVVEFTDGTRIQLRLPYASSPLT